MLPLSNGKYSSSYFSRKPVDEPIASSSCNAHHVDQMWLIYPRASHMRMPSSILFLRSDAAARGKQLALLVSVWL